MSDQLTQPARGTRDFLPNDLRVRRHAFQTIQKQFELHGFVQMDTPALERIEVLTGKYGEEGDMLMYKIMKRGEGEQSGEADLALRYDLTVPLARFVAEHRNDLSFPFRRFQIAPVWRAERPGKGRLREFYQCDIDIVGGAFPMADAEVITTLAETLRKLGLPSFTVKLNSRKVLLGMVEVYGIPEEKARDFFIGLDKLDKIGVAGVVVDLKGRGISAESTDKLAKDLDAPLEELRNRLAESAAGREGLEEVDTLLSLLSPSLGTELAFAPFLARGLDYYTGPIFEVVHPDLGSSLAGGGRYDQLVGMFSKQDVPTVGGSLGIERILLILKDSHAATATSPVLVTVWDESSRKNSLAIATLLRVEGIETEIYSGSGNLGKQLKYASDRYMQHVIIQGPDEASRDEVSVKDLATGGQETIAAGLLAATLKERLG